MCVPRCQLTPSSQALADALREAHVGVLAQALLRSSYGGFGTASLEFDAEDLAALHAHLRGRHPRARIVLLGHSTGCQGIVALVRAAPALDIAGVVLQARARGDMHSRM